MVKFTKNIDRLLHHKSRVFILDENSDVSEAIEEVEKLKYDVDGYTDCKSLLYNLHSRVMKQPYKIGILHETSSKSKTEALVKFIHNIDPNIRLITYRNKSELKNLDGDDKHFKYGLFNYQRKEPVTI